MKNIYILFLVLWLSPNLQAQSLSLKSNKTIVKTKPTRELSAGQKIIDKAFPLNTKSTSRAVIATIAAKQLNPKKAKTPKQYKRRIKGTTQSGKWMAQSISNMPAYNTCEIK